MTETVLSNWTWTLDRMLSAVSDAGGQTMLSRNGMGSPAV